MALKGPCDPSTRVHHSLCGAQGWTGLDSGCQGTPGRIGGEGRRSDMRRTPGDGLSCLNGGQGLAGDTSTGPCSGAGGKRLLGGSQLAAGLLGWIPLPKSPARGGVCPRPLNKPGAGPTVRWNRRGGQERCGAKGEERSSEGVGKGEGPLGRVHVEILDEAAVQHRRGEGVRWGRWLSGRRPSSSQVPGRRGVDREVWPYALSWQTNLSYAPGLVLVGLWLSDCGPTEILKYRGGRERDRGWERELKKTVAHAASDRHATYLGELERTGIAS